MLMPLRKMGHFVSPANANPRAGWKLDLCQVEEYPFGSGNPDRSDSGNSVLRLIPGALFRKDNLENQGAGNHLREFLIGVKDKYNEQPGVTQLKDTNKIVYCVDFRPSFTSYLPEDLGDRNFCAIPYGVEYTLTNYHVREDGSEEWDPWFDVPDTNRKNLEVLSYVQPDGNLIEEGTNPSEDDYALTANVPPLYCKYPSPGQLRYDETARQWNLAPGFGPVGRMDDIVSYQRCTDPPVARAAGANTRREEHKLVEGNQTLARTHPRDLNRRQAPSGGFLDPRIYSYLGCASDAGESADGEDEDPCSDDSDPCGDDTTNLPTTNGASPTQLPLPNQAQGGYSTGPITSIPPGQTSGAAIPFFVACNI